MVDQQETVKKYTGRINEFYILSQWTGQTTNENYRQWKDRIAEFKRVYRGEWLRKLPDGNKLVQQPIIENLAKNAIHDISGLAHQAHSSLRVFPMKETDSGYKNAEITQAAGDTHYLQNKGRKMERKYYMDLIGSGAAVAAVAFTSRSKYPVYTRLAPEFCWPDVRNGNLQSLVYIETIKHRVAQEMFPDDKLPKKQAWESDELDLVEYYDRNEVVRAFIVKPKDPRKDKPQAVITSRWVHKLNCVPVAFTMLDTFDDAFRGMLDQVEGPMLARNETVSYMQEYIESMVHSPFEAKNILNPEDLPGPFTIFHHDSTATESFMRRVAPAAPAQAVFGLVQYLEKEASGEAIQPPARQGTVTNSVASASFVNSTLGRLTTVIEELQESMMDFRKQLTELGFAVDVKWLDEEKPLSRAIGKKLMYLPSRDIGDSYFCEVQFGAMAGLDKLQGDQRVLQHLGARLIDRGTARRQVDYIDDPTVIQDMIDRDDMMDAFKARIAQDPRVTPAVSAAIVMAQSDGLSLIDAIKQVMPDLLTVSQPPAEGAPAQGEMPQAPGEPPMAPQEQADALQAGATSGPALPQGTFAPPPVENILARGTVGR